jgi:hypothetical protein
MTNDQDNINEGYYSGQSIGAGCARSSLLILLPALAAAIVISMAVALASLSRLVTPNEDAKVAGPALHVGQLAR